VERYSLDGGDNTWSSPLCLLFCSLRAPVLHQTAQCLSLMYIIVSKLNYLYWNWKKILWVKEMGLDMSHPPTVCSPPEIRDILSINPYKLKWYLKKGDHSLYCDNAEPTHMCFPFHLKIKMTTSKRFLQQFSFGAENSLTACQGIYMGKLTN
jgi:hypothetical protein